MKKKSSKKSLKKSAISQNLWVQNWNSEIRQSFTDDKLGLSNNFRLKGLLNNGNESGSCVINFQETVKLSPNFDSTSGTINMYLPYSSYESVLLFLQHSKGVAVSFSKERNGNTIAILSNADQQSPQPAKLKPRPPAESSVDLPK